MLDENAIRRFFKNFAIRRYAGSRVYLPVKIKGLDKIPEVYCGNTFSIPIDQTKLAVNVDIASSQSNQIQISSGVPHSS